jgi:hypothetical protein
MPGRGGVHLSHNFVAMQSEFEDDLYSQRRIFVSVIIIAKKKHAVC